MVYLEQSDCGLSFMENCDNGSLNSNIDSNKIAVAKSENTDKIIKLAKTLKVDQNFNLDIFQSELVPNYSETQIEFEFSAYLKNRNLSIILQNCKILTIDQVHLNSTKDFEELLNIFKLISTQVQSLRFKEFINCSNLKKNVDCSSISEFPHLENLNFSVFSDAGGGLCEKLFLNVIKSILDNVPCVKYIGIDSFPVNQGIFDTLCNSKAFSQIYQLEIGDWCILNAWKNDPIIVGSILNNLKLRELKICKIVGDNDNEKLLNGFLQSQCTSLEKIYLKFYVCEFSVFTKIQFSLFKDMKCLRLKLDYENENAEIIRWRDIIEPFNFTEKFPNLINLEIQYLDQILEFCSVGSKFEKLNKPNGQVYTIQ